MSYVANLVIFGSVSSFTNKHFLSLFQLWLSSDFKLQESCASYPASYFSSTKVLSKTCFFPDHRIEPRTCCMFFETVKVTSCLAPSMINSFATSSYKQIQQTEHLPPNKVHLQKLYSVFSPHVLGKLFWILVIVHLILSSF